MPRITLNGTVHTISEDEARRLCHELIDQLAAGGSGVSEAGAAAGDGRSMGGAPTPLEVAQAPRDSVPASTPPASTPPASPPPTSPPRPVPTPLETVRTTAEPDAPAPQPVYTSSTDDARTQPTPIVEADHVHDGCRFHLHTGVATVAHRYHLGEDDLATIAELPDETWISPLGNGAEVRIRGRHGVVVAADDPHYILALRTADSLRRQRDPHTTPHRTSERRPRPELAAIDTVRDMIEQLRRHGFEVELRKAGHYKITRPGSSEQAIMAASPSDHRWALNLRSQIRLRFGIDVRDEPADV